MRRRLGAGFGVVLAIGIAACGNHGEGRPTARHAANPTARADAQDLGRYLMRRGEEPGFRPEAAPGAMPRERATVTGVKALVNAWHLAAVDERRLTSEGFVSLTFQPIRGPRSAGVTEVSLYATAEGAERSLAHELRADVIRVAGRVADVRFFSVPGVPGARGWTASLPGEPANRAVGNVLWVQGRCLHVLGNQGPGPFVGPLSRGARAIYQRTSNRCPCAKQTAS
jgi:hypothetical protein